MNNWMDSISTIGGQWNSPWTTPMTGMPPGITMSQNGPYGSVAQPGNGGAGASSPWSNDMPGQQRGNLLGGFGQVAVNNGQLSPQDWIKFTGQNPSFEGFQNPLIYQGGYGESPGNAFGGGAYRNGGYWGDWGAGSPYNNALQGGANQSWNFWGNPMLSGGLML